MASMRGIRARKALESESKPRHADIQGTFNPPSRHLCENNAGRMEEGSLTASASLGRRVVTRPASAAPPAPERRDLRETEGSAWALSAIGPEDGAYPRTGAAMRAQASAALASIVGFALWCSEQIYAILVYTSRPLKRPTPISNF